MYHVILFIEHFTMDGDLVYVLPCLWYKICFVWCIGIYTKPSIFNWNIDLIQHNISWLINVTSLVKLHFIYINGKTEKRYMISLVNFILSIWILKLSKIFFLKLYNFFYQMSEMVIRDIKVELHGILSI